MDKTIPKKSPNTMPEPAFTYTFDEEKSTALEQLFFRLFDEVTKKNTNSN